MSAGGRAGADHVAHQLMGLPDAEAGLSHQADFTIRFQIQHRTNSPSPLDLRRRLVIALAPDKRSQIEPAAEPIGCRGRLDDPLDPLENLVRRAECRRSGAGSPALR